MVFSLYYLFSSALGHDFQLPILKASSQFPSLKEAVKENSNACTLRVRLVPDCHVKI
jgi:hypothetical protein